MVKEKHEKRVKEEVRMKRILPLTCLGLMVCIAVPAWAVTRHVAPPPLGSNTNPGTEELPFATIQHSIDASSHGDTVIVAQGTYVENIRFNGKNIVLTGTDPLDPAVVAATVIDGNQAGSVVTFSGTESEACVLEGFTIRNGQTAGDGGGIRGNGTGATIQNNTITGNSAGYGGGLYDCHGTIHNNTITGNSAEEDGGGLYWCHGTIQKNTVTGNSAIYGGGLSRCNGTIQNNTIAENSAEWGGALDDCNGTIRNCIIWANTALTDPQLFFSSAPTYSCIEGWTGGGKGNISDDRNRPVDTGGVWHGC